MTGPLRRKIAISSLILSFVFSSAFAEEPALSKPEPIPTPVVGAEGSSPSQGEGEKAPAEPKPAAVPEFSLPEVVITGENELTIGAQRLDRKENDVTMGSQELSGLNRNLNDLPGLEKTLTALATEDAGPSQDHALVLHLGGGIPETYGGWGLWGQELKDFEYLLSGYYSHWGGEAAGTGLDWDRKAGLSFETKINPTGPVNFLFSGGYRQVNDALPYQGPVTEGHQGLDFSGTGYFKLSDLLHAQVRLTHQETYLQGWDLSSISSTAQETEGQFKVTGEAIGDFLEGFSLEGGERHSVSGLSVSSNTHYDWGWLGLQGNFKRGENLLLSLKLQGQAGNGLALPIGFYPVADLTWRAFENSQVNLYWKTDRYVDNYQNFFLDTEHVAPGEGFPTPTEITGEWGGRFTQKILENLMGSVSASLQRIKGYHQWTDLNDLSPDHIQNYSTLGSVEIRKAAVNLQWSPITDIQVSATYEWTQGLNLDGDGSNLTALPTHHAILSVYRNVDQLEARAGLEFISSRNAFETQPGLLPSALTLGVDAAYHFSRTLSFWLQGDNLLGESYEIQPGYLEPRYHVRAGVEVIF